MLDFEVDGSGPPLLLVHGTLSSRGLWAPVREQLARERTLILVDLPGMGSSAAIEGADVPRDWIAAFDEVLAECGVQRPAVVGHSMGGWTALELAAAGRVRAALALAPAGLWGERSPRRANASIRMGHAMSRATPPWLAERALRVGAIRRAAMRDLSVDAARVPAEWVIAASGDGRRATGFRAHFRAARRDRFSAPIAPDIGVHVVFAGADRIVSPALGQRTDELPAHAVVERWPDTGHTVIWDLPERVVAAALAL